MFSTRETKIPTHSKLIKKSIKILNHCYYPQNKFNTRNRCVTKTYLQQKRKICHHSYRGALLMDIVFQIIPFHVFPSIMKSITIVVSGLD